MLSGKWRPFCRCANVLTLDGIAVIYGLWLDGTKPFPEPVLTYHQQDSEDSRKKKKIPYFHFSGHTDNGGCCNIWYPSYMHLD